MSFGAMRVVELKVLFEPSRIHLSPLGGVYSITYSLGAIFTDLKAAPNHVSK